MANCISGLISNMLRDYIEPLEGNQVSVSIWNGDAELRDMILKPTALFKAGAPLGVVKGTIGNIKIHYPWGIRDVRPTSIKITDISIESEYIEEVKLKRIQTREKESQKEHEKEDNEPHNTSFLGRFFSSISDNVNKKIVSNLIVEINQFDFIVHMKTVNVKQDVSITMHFNNLRLNMQNENSYFAVDNLLFSINSKKSGKLDPKAKMKFEMKSFTADTNKTTSSIILNQPLFLLDINAFEVPDVFVTVQNSPWYQSKNHSNPKPSETDTKKESQNTFVTKYSISEMKVNVYDKNIDFNVYLNGNINMCGLKKNLQIDTFNLYITEDDHQYPYIFHDMIIQIEQNDTDFYFDLNYFNPSLSYSDMIDLSNFYHKREKLLSFYNEKIKDTEDEDKTDEETENDNKKKHHKKHHKKLHHKKHHNKKNKNKDNDDEDETEENYYNDGNETNSDKTPIQKHTWHFKPFEFQFLIYENNRTKNIPYPFFRMVSHVPEITTIFDKESIIPIPKFECDIFNKKTQKWDILMEPVSMMVHMTNKNQYDTKFENPINLVCSIQSLIQINQFSHKRLKYNSKEKYPHYFIENNTNDACKIKCNSKHSLIIEAYQTKEFVYKQPFEFKNIKINPLTFFSPSFVTNTLSVSIFTENDKKIISINTAIQIKNKSSLKLYFHTSTNKVTEIRANGITALDTFSPKFLINGTDEVINDSQMINFDKIKEQKKMLINLSINDQTYNLLLSYKFSKKKGIFMLLIRPHYKIVNELHIPIKFIIPKINSNLELKEASTGYIDDIGEEEKIQCIIEMNNMKSEELSFNVKEQKTIPVKFENNQLLSIFYNDYIILIKPPMTIKNQTQFPIKIYDSNGQLAIEAKEKDDLSFGTSEYFDSDKIKISFQISNYSKSELFELQDGRNEFLLKSEAKQNLFYPIGFANYLGANGVFHLFIDSQIKIKNKTTKQIIFYPIDQTNKQCDDSIAVKPNEICPITKVSKTFNFSINFDKSTSNHIVSFKFNSEKQIIKENNFKVEIQTRLKFSNISYYVIFHELDDKDEIQKDSDDKQAETFSLAVNVPVFAISVLDEKMREMFNFAFKGITYKYEPGNEKEPFNGTVNDFQIDDMFPGTKIKNVLYTKIHPFITGRVHKDDDINICDVQINPVVFNFDFNFVSNVLTDMMKMYKYEPEKKKEEEEEEEEEKSENNVYDPSYYSLHESNEKIDYYIAPENGYFITVQQLNIKPFSFGINFCQNLRPTFQDFEFGSIPYLNDSTYNFVFKFNQFTMNNLNATFDELMNIFYESYYSGFILSFFNSSPLNPSNILKNFNILKSKGGIATIDFNKIEYRDIFTSFHKRLTFKIDEKEISKETTKKGDWLRYPRSLNYENQILPYDEDASICQIKLQKEINNFDEYLILFVKINDKKFFGISQFYFIDFSKKIVDNQSHFKLAKIHKFNEIKSVEVSGQIVTLDFIDSSNEKINCENVEIATKVHKVIFNQVNATGILEISNNN